MIIPLIQCPSWNLDSPPYNISLLKSVLKKEGFEPVCFDFNLEFYNQVSDDLEKETWFSMARGVCWEDDFNFVLRIIDKNDSFIKDFIQKIIKLNSKVICFTVNQRNIFFTSEVVKQIKNIDSDKIIIFGGPHCFRNIYVLELFSKFCVDALCLGEGEITLVHFLRIIQDRGKLDYCPGFAYKNEQNEIVDCGDGPIAENLDSLPFADFSDFDVSKYRGKSIPILTSKGCINRCSFCSERINMGRFRVRSAENIFAEMVYQLSKFQYIEEFYFTDSLVNGDISTLEKLSELIIKNNLKFKWSGQAVIRKEMTPDLLRKLRQSGCYGLSYGVESGSDKILRLMRKGYNSELAERVLRDTYNAGIGINFNIIVGFLGEEETEFQQTLEFVRRNLQYTQTVTLNLLSIGPDTELHKNAQKWGFRPSDDKEVDWYTSDGKNNLAERLRRLEQLREVTKEKASIDSNKEVDFNLKLGDLYLQKGESERALKHYYIASEKNRDENRKYSIDTKINSVKKSAEHNDYDERKIDRRISFSWDILYACNYRCPYCWWYGRWQHILNSNRYLSVGELVRYWDNIYRKYGSTRIEILGGEPFIYPNFKDLIKELSKMHMLSISTNLSTNIKDFTEQVNPQAVEMICSFHPLFADFDSFVKKIILLKGKGFRCAVPYLAYPPQIKLLDYYRNKFAREQVTFNVLTFWGKYNSLDYPDAYTQGERKIIEPNLAQCGGENFQLSGINSPRGKLCYAGCLHACIHPDGETIRCGGGGYGGFNQVIGNFFDDNFKLLDGPAPCPSDTCPCNEWAYLLEEIVEKDKEL